jgi:uncharacterized protein (TIRG00374 family)
MWVRYLVSKPTGRVRRQILLATSISIVSIIIIFKFTGTDVTWKALSEIDIRFLLLAFILHLSSWIFSSLRLKLLTSLAGHEVSFELSFRSTLATAFIGSLTPSAIGGEPMRIKILADDGMSYGAATAVAVIERLLDSLFFISGLAIFLMISGFLTGFGLEIGGIFLFILVLSLIFLWQVVVRPDRIERLLGWMKRKAGNRKFMDKISQEMWHFRDAGIQLANKTEADMPIMIFLTDLTWIIDSLVPSAILIGLGTSPYYLFSITSQLILAIIALLPLTPGGVGVTEFSMTYLYSMFLSHNLLGPLIVLWRLVTYFANIAVGSAFTGASISGGSKNHNP